MQIKVQTEAGLCSLIAAPGRVVFNGGTLRVAEARALGAYLQEVAASADTQAAELAQKLVQATALPVAA